ncbi:hypothetical protein CRD60_06635 [Bifidobacterium aemilianum]|uniref:Uncharacterized protein n=1 Tax=Bifidobacterium aemilianum TaxID=2493120 RepID=A0A366K866_9BIFI|nr:hypothetical protein [Bifidobacterium aemilianum]RBP97442.1 hypothetical protein CRD60_06635 [Bifidobacterium aemilianum]
MTVTLSDGNIAQTFDGKEVLQGVDMDLRPGDVLGFLSSIGAGESTLFIILLSCPLLLAVVLAVASIRSHQKV